MAKQAMAFKTQIHHKDNSEGGSQLSKMKMPGNQVWFFICIALTLDGCSQINLRDKQLQVFERNLKTLQTQASTSQNLIENAQQQKNLCRKSLQLAEGLTKKEISSGRYDLIFWRFHLIRNLVESHKRRIYDLSYETRNLAELSSLCMKQLSELGEAKYAGLKIRERAPSYELLGTAFLELGKIDLAETCSKRAMQLYEGSFGKESSFLIPSLADLVEINEQQGNLATAAAVCKRLIAITLKTPAQPSLFRAAQYYKLADLSERLHRTSEADEAFREGASIFTLLPSSSNMSALILPDSLSYILIRQFPSNIAPIAPELLKFYNPDRASSVRNFNILDLQTNWRYLLPKNAGAAIDPSDTVFIYADVLRHCLIKIGRARALKLFPWAESALRNREIMLINRSELPRKNLPYTNLSGRLLVVLQTVGIPKKDWDKIKIESKITKDELAKIWKLNNDDYVTGLQLQKDPP